MQTMQQRLAGLPASVTQQIAASIEAFEAGRIEDAERCVIAALAVAPGHPEILRQLGSIQGVLGRYDEAVASLVQSLKQRPYDAETMHQLAIAYLGQRDMANAFGASKRACELAPEQVEFWFTLGKILSARSQHELAVVALQHTLKLAPGHAGARIALAHVMNAEGRMQDAASQYRGVLDGNSAAGEAWWGLATLKPMPLEAADITAMQHLLDGDLGLTDRIAIGFALGHALEHAKDFAGAFEALRAANTAAHAAYPWKRSAAEERLNKVGEAFSGPVVDADDGQGAEIIFITSMPRSGSTLTEQILASHSQIEGTSELHDILQVIVDESDRVRRPFPDWVSTHTPAEWKTLGRRYLERTARWRKMRPRMTDKMPGNWLYIGAIRRMLPGARIIVARRDPLETCFGCYRYLFTGHEYTHAFADLGLFWRGFDRLCNFWAGQSPDRVRQQQYEDLIADPERQIRSLLKFCDLPFEQACLDFHKTERRVTTPSAGQVREPIRRDTARTGKYGALLDPLRKELGLPPFGA